ncbi:MAG: histidine kinase [Deltaproteobacteria bacterium]
MSAVEAAKTVRAALTSDANMGSYTVTIEDSRTRSERILAVSRFILAVSALAIALADPGKPLVGPRPLYLLVTLYSIYSGLLLWLFSRQRQNLSAFSKPILFADIAFFSVIVGLSEGGINLFYLFYIFAICSAAIQWGLRMTIKVAVLSALMYLASVLTIRRIALGPDFLLHSAHFIRPTYLVLLGYLVGLLGEHELAAKRRLLTVLAMQQDAGHGHSTLAMLVRLILRMADFFEADYMLVQLRTAGGPGLELEGKRTAAKRLVLRSVPEQAWLPASSGPLSYRLGYEFGNWGRSVESYKPGNMSAKTVPESEEPPFLARSRMRSLISVPIFSPGGFRGRIIVGRARSNLSRENLDFCRTLVDQGTIILDNIMLQGKAEALAVAEERARIARDVHDGFVQSLASLDVGLEVCRKLEKKDPARLASELADLQRNVKQGYLEARHYLEQLRDKSVHGADVETAVAEVVREFRSRGEAEIELRANLEGLPARDGVGFEVVQIVREGLTNVFRHAAASKVLVSVEAIDEALEVIIRDNGCGFPAAAKSANGELPPTEAPWSIRGRVEALGGTLGLRSQVGGGSEIRVTLPNQGALPSQN